MNPELKQNGDSLNYEVETPTVEVNVDTDTVGTLVADPTSTRSSEQWRQIGEKFSSILADLPDYLTDFFSQYRRPIITIGLLFGAIVSVKLTLAILDAINDIPLLAPTFELIGLGYGAWFVYRYLLRASNRKELAEDIGGLKDQIVGRGFPKS